MIRLWTSLLASTLALAAQPSYWQRREKLGAENLRSAGAWFQKSDPRLKFFQARDKLPVKAGYSILVADARVSRETVEGSFGVFVVYGRTNQVYMVIDVFPTQEFRGQGPVLEEGPSGQAVRLHFFGDYGLYGGSLKYVYDLKQRQPARRFRYQRMGLVARRLEEGVIQYATEEGCPAFERRWRVVIRPSGDALPEFRVIDEAPCAAVTPVPAAPMAVKGTAYQLQVRKDQPGSNEPSGVELISKSGRKTFHALPLPTPETFLRLRPDEVNVRHGWRPATENVNHQIGTYALEGTTLWFAHDFYAGEGMWGVGAIGSFDVSSRKYTIRYLPEIAPWAGSAMLLDGDDVWIGLMRRPEGAPYGGGLLRWNRTTGAVRKFTFDDVVHTIDRLGDTLYLGASYGLYTLRGKTLTHLRFEPGPDGKLTMPARILLRQPEVVP